MQYKILSLDIDRGDNYAKKIMISCLFIVLFALDFAQKNNYPLSCFSGLCIEGCEMVR